MLINIDIFCKLLMLMELNADIFCEINVESILTFSVNC